MMLKYQSANITIFSCFLHFLKYFTISTYLHIHNESKHMIVKHPNVNITTTKQFCGEKIGYVSRPLDTS